MSDLASTSEKERQIEAAAWAILLVRFYKPEPEMYASLGAFYTDLRKSDHWPEALAEAEAVIAALASPAPAESGEPVADGANRMCKISELIAELQETQDRFGDSCVYIRRGGLSWGAVALNRQADDKKHGVFDLQAAHDRAMSDRLGQVERLMADRNEWRDRAVKAEIAGSPSTSGVGVRAWLLNHEVHGERLSMAPITDGDRSLGWVDTPLGAIPDGWALVPRELTSEMKAAVRKNGGMQALAFALAAWPDLLSAAPLVYPSDPSRDTQPALLSTDETKEGGNG